jgi:hypothetical protein
MRGLRILDWWALAMLVACANSEMASSDEMNSSDEIEEGDSNNDSDTEQGLGGRAQSNTSGSSEVDDDQSAGLADQASGGTGPGDQDDDESGDDPAGGAAGASGSSGAEGGASGSAGTASCPEPIGDDITVSSYTPPATAAGCNFGVIQGFSAPEVSATLTSEAEFREFFQCPEQAASGIDFGAQRLRASVVREAGFVAPSRQHAVIDGGDITLAFELPVYCGGAFPPTAVVLTLLPAGTEAVREDVCRLGDCGAGGFPP